MINTQNAVKLTDKNYWEKTYDQTNFDIIQKQDTLRKWIEAHISKVEGEKDALEIGCYPARYLAVFGELGYKLNGVDIVDGVDTKIPEWLTDKGYKTGSFYKSDIFQFEPKNQYDLVCSFGFIEHFTNYKEVIEKHLKLVKQSGLVVIETPNFRGFVQNFLHRFLDKTNYDRHFIPSMNPQEWETILKNEGFEIITSGYFGGFDFWSENENLNILQKILIKSLYILKYTIKVLGINLNHSSFSAYCGIIAKKL